MMTDNRDPLQPESTPEIGQGQQDPGMRLLDELVTEIDIYEFCSEKLDDNLCPVCKKGRFHAFLYSPTYNRVTAVVSVKVEGGEASRFLLDAERFIPVFYVLCDNCGHLRYHAISAVIEWKKSKERA